MYLVTIFMATLTISFIEPFSFREIIFEVISALGTVGLSMGITPLLSDPSKIVLIFLMFWGRVGVLTFIYGMMSRDTGNCISYARANIPIG
jgi:trk system potassium uptake protein TrkH